MYILLVGVIRQIQMPDCSLLSEHHHSYDTSRASVPLDGLLQRAFDELDGSSLVHTLLPICVTITIDVCRARTSDRIRLLVQRTAERYRVDLAAVSFVPTSNDKASAIEVSTNLRSN